MKNYLLILFASSILCFQSCTSKNTDSTSDSTSAEITTSAPDTSGIIKPRGDIDLSFEVTLLNPTKDTSNRPKNPFFFIVTDTLKIKNALKKNADIDEEIAKIGGVDMKSKNFEIDMKTFVDFINTIPDDGYLGVAYGIEKTASSYKNLSLGLFSLDSKYKENSFIGINNFSVEKAKNFKEVKNKLNSKGLTSFNPDSKYDKVIFKKSSTVGFFAGFGSSFKKKVYLYYIPDMYNSEVAFPNVFVSNVKGLNENTVFSSLSKEALVIANKGQYCCPPPPVL